MYVHPHYYLAKCPFAIDKETHFFLAINMNQELNLAGYETLIIWNCARNYHVYKLKH